MADYVRRIRALIGSGELLQLPSVSVAIREAGGRVLLARHVEGNRWLLPGGGVEPGETPADAAVREAWDETGLNRPPDAARGRVRRAAIRRPLSQR